MPEPDDPFGDLDVAAIHLREIFDALKRQEFTDEQALALTLAMVTTYRPPQ